MELKIRSTKINKTSKLLSFAAISMLFGFVTPLYAVPPNNGQLVVINGLANVIDGSPGNTASSIKIEVFDSTGICSTSASVVYGGVATIKWDATKAHSTTQCTGITTVNITALKTGAGVVQYDSTANSTPPAVATAATTFTAPTTPITNLSLIVSGNGTPASTVVASGTVWGIGAASTPAYDTNNGGIVTTGVMGGVGAKGLQAMEVMRNYRIEPLF
jgi:hypothetical protein